MVRPPAKSSFLLYYSPPPCFLYVDKPSGPLFLHQLPSGTKLLRIVLAPHLSCSLPLGFFAGCRFTGPTVFKKGWLFHKPTLSLPPFLSVFFELVSLFFFSPFPAPFFPPRGRLFGAGLLFFGFVFTLDSWRYVPFSFFVFLYFWTRSLLSFSLFPQFPCLFRQPAHALPSDPPPFSSLCFYHNHGPPFE